MLVAVVIFYYSIYDLWQGLRFHRKRHNEPPGCLCLVCGSQDMLLAGVLPATMISKISAERGCYVSNWKLLGALIASFTRLVGDAGRLL